MRNVLLVIGGAGAIFGMLLGATALSRPSPEQIAASLKPDFAAIDLWGGEPGSSSPGADAHADKIVVVLAAGADRFRDNQRVAQQVLAEIPAGSHLGLALPSGVIANVSRDAAIARAAAAAPAGRSLAAQLEDGAQLLSEAGERDGGGGRYFLLVIGGGARHADGAIQAMRGLISHLVQRTPIQLATISQRPPRGDPLDLPGAVWRIDPDRLEADIAAMLAPDLAELWVH